MRAEYTAGLEVNEQVVTKLLQWGFTGRRVPVGYNLDLHAIKRSQGRLEPTTVSLQLVRSDADWYSVFSDAQTLAGLRDFLDSEARNGEVFLVTRHSN